MIAFQGIFQKEQWAILQLCFVAKPLIWSEVKGNLVAIETSI